MSNRHPSEATRQRQMRTWALRNAVVRAAMRVHDANATRNPMLQSECVDQLLVAVREYLRRNEMPP